MITRKAHADLRKTARAGWAVAKFCLDQYEGGLALTEAQLDILQEVQLEFAAWLAKFEDGPAVMFISEELRRSMRATEQVATDLLFAIAKSEVSHGQQEGSREDRRGLVSAGRAREAPE